MNEETSGKDDNLFELRNDGEFVHVGECANCGESIPIGTEQMPTFEQEFYGKLQCPNCEYINGAISHCGQDELKVGELNDIWLESQMSQGDSKPAIRSSNAARNTQETYCHYCGCELQAGAGFMASVPSVNGNEMRRTVCQFCLGRPGKAWEEIAEVNRNEKLLALVLLIGGIALSAILIAIFN